MHNEQHSALHTEQHLVLHPGQPIKEKNKKNNKKTEAVEGDYNILPICSPPAPAASAFPSSFSPDIGSKSQTQLQVTYESPEVRCGLIKLYKICCFYFPNRFEIKAIKREIFFDRRLSPHDILPIIRASFEKVAICPRSKKNTIYLLGIIRSKKKEFLTKLEKQKAEEEKLLSQERNKKNQEEYVPGTFFNCYLEAMEKRGKE